MGGTMKTVQVPLYRRDGSVRCFTLIDAADAEWVNQWKWFGLLANRGHRYAARRGPKINGKYTTIMLHRELLGLPRVWAGLDGDHINHDRLDNRRANLRAVPHGHNVNNHPGCGGSSQYRGVSWNSVAQRWTAQTRYASLGYYATELDAAKVAARWRAVHYPGTVEDPALLAGPDPIPSRRPRGKSGERNPAAKLTRDIVLAARARYAQDGVSISRLAREYGVARDTIRLALRGQTWHHVA